MTTNPLFRYYVAAVSSIWFVTAITLTTELYPPLKVLVASVFLHHWLGKSILTLVVFGLVVVAVPERQFDERRWANYVLVSIVAGSFVILGFFVLHYFTA